MQITHHPDQFLLSDYTAGSVAPAMALPVAVHLEYCERCSREYRELAELGAGTFDALDPVPVCGDALDKVLQQLEDSPQDCAVVRSTEGLPRALSSLVRGGIAALDWERQGRGLKVARLHFGDLAREVSLHRISAGKRVPAHGHGGNEITVVLSGGFSDEDGDYRPGDYAVRVPGESHRPVAWTDSDCLCLSIQDGPIRFEGMFSRLLNPFIGLRAR